MKKLLVVLIIACSPSLALAGDWTIEIDTKLQYNHNFHGKHFVEPGIKVTTQANVKRPQASLQIAPYASYGFDNFKIGPEIRFPVIGAKNNQYLLSAEFTLP